jgi:hypothetical protein
VPDSVKSALHDAHLFVEPSSAQPSVAAVAPTNGVPFAHLHEFRMHGMVA